MYQTLLESRTAKQLGKLLAYKVLFVNLLETSNLFGLDGIQGVKVRSDIVRYHIVGIPLLLNFVVIHGGERVTILLPTMLI